MVKEIIKIEGMMCGHCQANVERSVSTLNGVTDVNVDLAAKQATVTFDPALASLDDIKAAVKDAGYIVIA